MLIVLFKNKKRGALMTIFEGLILVLTFAGMTAVYEWRQDVISRSRI
jgi:hypothetical protein